MSAESEPIRFARDRRRCRGLSLLEVMLAIAILGGALATLGQLVRIGARSSATVRDLTQGQLLCENKLAEIAAGVVLPEPITQEPAEETGEWLVSVSVEAVDDLGLLGVTVRDAGRIRSQSVDVCGKLQGGRPATAGLQARS